MATTSSDKTEMTIVTEVPPSLDKALLLMVKNFFSPEHYLLVYYIMRAVCIREENLRSKVQFDQKQLRQQLASLKAEKLVKERLLQQKNENGRSQSIIFYFINYRAILNVLKYKIDHMRQRLEAREKEDTQKAIYKCGQCGSQYETLDVDRIYDPFAGILKCWRCQGEVTQDESGGPTQATRSLLARFNEQMLPLFAVVRELAGVQLAPHLLEPDLNKYLAEEDKERNEAMQLLDFSQPDQKIALGAKAYSAARSGPYIKYAEGDTITVDLNADLNSKPMEEAKQVPLWLQDDAIGTAAEHDQAAAALSAESGLSSMGLPEVDVKPNMRSTMAVNLLHELEGGDHEEPEAKRVKQEPGSNGLDGYPLTDSAKKEETDNEDEDEEEEVMLFVQGKEMPFSEVTPELVESMTEEERGIYEAIVMEHMADQF